MNMTSIVIKDLTKSFGSTIALNNISLTINGAFGLLGQNGAGKTTLMRILATLENPQNGTVTMGETTWDKKKSVRPFIGYLPQNFSMYKNLKVIEVMQHLAILKELVNKAERTSEIQAILQSVNLLDHQYNKVKSLSGGMLRRLGIAQSLLANPKILIVDEPTAGLDIEERVRFRKLLREIAKDRIIIISTHIVEDLESICDNIAIIKQGNVILSGTRQEITRVPEGKVWEMKVPIENLEQFMSGKNVVSSKQFQDYYLVRFFSEKPEENAARAEPNLEDAYLYLTRDGE